MPKIRKELIMGKAQQILYIDKTLIKKLKSYAMEIDTTFLKLIEPEQQQFEQLLIAKAGQIDEIRAKAFEARKKEQEIRKIAEENPIQVSGHMEDPIGDQEAIAAAQTN